MVLLLTESVSSKKVVLNPLWWLHTQNDTNCVTAQILVDLTVFEKMYRFFFLVSVMVMDTAAPFISHSPHSEELKGQIPLKIIDLADFNFIRCGFGPSAGACVLVQGTAFTNTSCRLQKRY